MKTFILFIICLPTSALALEFRLLSWKGDIGELYYTDRGQRVEVNANDYIPSIPYQKSDTKSLELCRDIPMPDGPARRQVVALIALPEPAIARAILILTTTPEGYAGRWLDDSPSVHPVNTIRVYNFSSRALAFQAAGEQWQQSPGDIHLVAFDPASRQFSIHIATQVNDAWQLVAGGPQPVRKNNRIHLLIRDIRPSEDDRSGEYVDLLFFRDPVPPDAKPPAN
jgi:hypothetical protein